MIPEHELVQGNLPLPIDTSLAFEEIFNTMSTFDYGQMYVNVRTLIRNHISAMHLRKKEMGELLDAASQTVAIQTLANLVINQMYILKNEFGSRYKKDIVFYLANYDVIKRDCPNARLRITDKQDADQAKVPVWELETKISITIHHTLKMSKDSTQVILYNNGLFGDGKRSLVFTHIPYDLLGRNFTRVDLLESHTGKIKHEGLMYTKYYNGNELPPLPFSKELLQIFGDRVLFRPIQIDVRKKFLEASKKYHWGTTTSLDRIRLGIQLFADQRLSTMTYPHLFK